MSKQSTRPNPRRFGEEALAASRQVWLAGLGVAAYTCDWVQAEAGNTFRHLVKEGTVVESRAVAFVGDQIEGSMSRANHLWQRTRLTVRGTVRQAADAAVSLANQALPKSLPQIAIPGLWRGEHETRAAPRATVRKTARKPAAKRTTAAKRAAKPAPVRKRRAAAVA